MHVTGIRLMSAVGTHLAVPGHCDYVWRGPVLKGTVQGQITRRQKHGEAPGRRRVKPAEHTLRGLGPWNTMGRPPTFGALASRGVPWFCVGHGCQAAGKCPPGQAGHGLGAGLESDEGQQATAGTEESSSSFMCWASL